MLSCSLSHVLYRVLCRVLYHVLQEGLYIPELVFGNLLTGSNFSADAGAAAEDTAAAEGAAQGMHLCGV